MLFFNEDWMHFICRKYEQNEAVNERVLRDFIYQYKGTQITDFCLNVNGTVSTAPSKVLETFADKYHAKLENGLPVDYTKSYASVVYDLIEVQGIDQYRIWVDALREIGIRPWISVRMNDCHGNMNPTDLYKSSTVEERSDLWRIRHRPANGYYDKCFDYTLTDTRRMMLDYITEMLERYEPDGLELDFSREMYITSPGNEYDMIPIMTEFVAEVRAVADRVAASAGHPVKVGVLIGANASAVLGRGFDVHTWCERGLVDLVTVIPRWETINPNMDIALWKRLLSNDVMLGTGLQIMLNPTTEYIWKMATVDHDFGQAVANLSLGADYIYLYNHFDTPLGDMIRFALEHSVREADSLDRILHNIGTLDTALNFKRRHVLTFDDTVAPWETMRSRLPMPVYGEYQQLRIAVGQIPAGKCVTFVAGFKESVEVDKLHLYINSHELTFLCDGGRYDGRDASYTFSVPEGIIHNYALVEISYEGMAQMNFAEIVVE